MDTTLDSSISGGGAGQPLDSSSLESDQFPYFRMEALLARAPRGSTQELTPVEERQFIEEQEALARFSFEHPGEESQARFITDMVTGTLIRHGLANGGEPWQLIPFDDLRRIEPDPRVAFGQVRFGDEPSFFVGRGLATRNGMLAQFVYRVEARAAITEAVPLADGAPEHGELVREELSRRNPAPWSLQVDRDSALGKWVDSLFAEGRLEVRLGQHRGELSLGVIAERVCEALCDAGYSHFYLPRARRRGGSEPWHTGQFMQYDRGDFVWKGHALDSSGNAVLATVRVGCDVVDFDLKVRGSAPGAEQRNWTN